MISTLWGQGGGANGHRYVKAIRRVARRINNPKETDMGSSHRWWGAARIGAFIALSALWFVPAASAQQLTVDHVNRGLVEIETGTADGISVKMANDLADLLDDGATRRVLPVMGEGSLQNIVDLKLLRGIDLAIIQADALDYARAQKLMQGLESITYVARLYNEEFHLLARANIKTVQDLKGKKVNIDVQGAGTGVTADKIFTALGLTVERTRFATSLAVAKLAKGEIDAVAFVAGKPAPVFRNLDGSDGLHFLSLPLNPTIASAYAPTRITSKDYPGLVSAEGPIDTVAVGMVLTAANLQTLSDRYRNVANFVDAFFTQFSSLLEPGHHPKWREVNLAAELPGWKRFGPAEQWLSRNNTVVAKQSTPQDLRQVFERFLEERLRLTGAPTMSQKQKDALFGEFQNWQTSQAR
jgi:TRAP transporter TAXI family solute receptor